jgi:hypothetical protein
VGWWGTASTRMVFPSHHVKMTLISSETSDSSLMSGFDFWVAPNSCLKGRGLDCAARLADSRAASAHWNPAGA